MINTRHHFIPTLFWHMTQIACILYVGFKNNQSNPGNINLCRCWWKAGQETLCSSDNSAAPCQGAGAEGAWHHRLAKLLLSWISNTLICQRFWASRFLVAFLVTDILCWMKTGYFHPGRGNSFPSDGPFKSQLISVVLTPSRNFYLASLGLSVGLISVAHSSLCKDEAGLFLRQGEAHHCRRQENKHSHSIINLIEQMDTVIRAKTILPRILTFQQFIRKGVLTPVNNFLIIAITS